MPKIEDSLMQARVPQNLPEIGGGNSAPHSNKPDAAANKLIDHANLKDAAPPHETHGERKQELQSRLPLAGQMLRHNLQSFDKTASKHLQQQQHGSHDQTRDTRGMPKQNDYPHRQNVSVDVSVKVKHNSADASVHAQNGLTEAVAAPKNALKTVEQHLFKCAEKAGLPVHEQKDFADKFTNKFVAEAKSKGAEKLLEKTGDLSLLSNSRVVARVKVGDQVAVNLGAEASADLKSRQIKLGINANANGGVAVKPNNPPNPQNPILGNSRFGSPNQFPGNSAPRGNFAAATLGNNFSNVQILSRREIGEFKNDLIGRVADILQRLGVDPGEIEALKRGDLTPPDGEINQPEDLRGAAQLFGGTNVAAEDDALFASALGIAAEAAGESRVLNGDGLLLEFANYGAAKNDALSLDALVQNLLQTGTKVGLENLLGAVKSDLNDQTLNSLAQVADKMPTGGKKDFVVGVLTMSVMTRETLERLDTISSGASLGLSDDAMAALQKAGNNLRDHLTAQDLIGATGDAKGAPVSINGETYSFLPEVTEATNSLRDARNRVLAETAGANGIAAASRFAVEADALFNIVRNVETMLQI